MRSQCLLLAALSLLRSATSFIGTPASSGVFFEQSTSPASTSKLGSAEVPVWQPGPATVTVERLSKHFPGEGLFNKKRTLALDDINLKFTCAGPIALVGDAGSGKTTFLKILGGREQPTEGSITVDSARQLVYLRKAFSYDADSSVIANVRSRLARFAPLMPAAAAAAAADHFITIWGVGCRATLKARQLSGGDVLRFGLAMALAKGAAGLLPPVLLCDEFLDHEDSRVRVRVEAIMKQLSRDHGVGIIFSSHSMTTVIELADAAIVFSGGQVIQAGPTSEMAYIRSRFERRTRKLKQARDASDIVARAFDNLVHLRAPTATVVKQIKPSSAAAKDAVSSSAGSSSSGSSSKQ